MKEALAELERLRQLLLAPEPGLFTWHQAVAESYARLFIGYYGPKGVCRCQRKTEP